MRVQPNLRKKLGTNIREARESRKMTLVEIAEKIDTSVDLLSKYERGERAPTVEVLNNLSDILRVPIDVLFNKKTMYKELGDELSAEQIAKKKVTAFVTIDVSLGETEKVLNLLKEVDGIVEAAAIFGDKDIIAKIVVPDANTLNEVVMRDIRAFDKVKSTRTYIVMGDYHWVKK